MSQLRVVAVYFRINILNEFQYRVNFIVQAFQSILALIVALGGVWVVYDHTESLNGWTSPELLAVVGVYFIIGGLINTIIQPSMQALMEEVRSGALDFALVKPIETQLLISVRKIQVWKLIDVVIGVIVLGAGLAEIGADVDALDIFAFTFLLMAGGAIVYSFWLVLATFTFWFVRIDNILVIFQSMYDAGRWPVRIYPGWLQFTLTFLVPVSFAVTVPVEALTGRLTAQTVVSACVLAALMLAGSRRFWKFGLRFYSGASA